MIRPAIYTEANAPGMWQAFAAMPAGYAPIMSAGIIILRKKFQS